MEVEITREQVIEAILSEPLATLRPGTWASSGEPATDTVRGPACHVCAVGAVLRGVLDGSQRAFAICDVAGLNIGDYECVPDEDEDDLSRVTEVGASFAEEKPLAALSYVFEGLCAEAFERRGAKIDDLTDDEIAGVRARLVAFVVAHLPATLRIQTGKWKPAADAKVVA